MNAVLRSLSELADRVPVFRLRFTRDAGVLDKTLQFPWSMRDSEKGAMCRACTTPSSAGGSALEVQADSGEVAPLGEEPGTRLALASQ